MTAFNYRIADEIFQRFPGYVRGVVIAHELANGPSPPAEVEQAGMEIIELVQRYCGGRARFALLGVDQPSTSLAA